MTLLRSINLFAALINLLSSCPCVHAQLSQRRKGNELFKKGDLKGALSHYEQAECIIASISGTSQADQEEVDHNRATVLLNIAAVHMGLKQYATAASNCSRALSIQPENVKGLIRRAKCRCFMHEYQVRLVAVVACVPL